MNVSSRRYFLVLAQGVGRSGATISVTVMALAGLQISGSTVGGSLVYACNYVGLILAALLLAPLMSRFGRRGVYCGAGVIGVAAGLLGALSLSTGLFGLLVLAHLLFAFFLSSVNSYRFAILEVTPEGKKQQALSLVLFGGIVAALLGPFLARNAEKFLPGEGFIPVYFSLSLLAVAVLLLLPLVPLASRTGPRRGKFNISQYVNLFRQPFFASALSASALSQFVMILMMGATGLHLNRIGASYVTVTVVIQLHVLAMFVPSLLTGTLVAKFGVLRMMSVGVLFLLLAGGAGLFWDGVTATALCLMLVGLGWNFLYTSGSYLVGTIFVGKQRFLAQGVADANDNVLSAIASVLAGLLLPWIGWQGLSGLLLAAGLAYVLHLLLNGRALVAHLREVASG